MTSPMYSPPPPAPAPPLKATASPPPGPQIALGTLGGLARKDGSRFKLLSSNSAVPHQLGVERKKSRGGGFAPASGLDWHGSAPRPIRSMQSLSTPMALAEGS